MSDYHSLMRLIESEGIEFVDFRVVDLAGRFRHVTIPASRFRPELMASGIGFDGSNYGYRGVAHSDMVLLPDLSTAYVDVRKGERILTIIGDICEAGSLQPALADPRSIARRAEEYLRSTGVADAAMVSPEFEFYVFQSSFFDNDPDRSRAEVVPIEGREHRDRPGKGPMCSSGYHAPLPQDQLFSVRNEMVRQIQAAGIEVKYHHHEVGVFGQHEIELGFAPLRRMADATLIVKSIVRNVAAEAGLTATFLPKPLFGEAGSGMHLHQFLVAGGRNLFRGSQGLSDVALSYVAGLLKHGRSLMAFTNPSTNSYRRLVPGYEAPVYLVYGEANRSAAVRVPLYASGEDMRIELRTMDGACNPYLAFAAILMAGIDGVQQRLDARAMGYGPCDADCYEQMVAAEPGPRDLDEALDGLARDHDYLTAGGVFAPEDIEHWIAVKRAEAAAVAARPHPYEFALYYDL